MPEKKCREVLSKFNKRRKKLPHLRSGYFTSNSQREIYRNPGGLVDRKFQ